MKNVLKLMARKFVEEVEQQIEQQINEAVATKVLAIEAKYAKAAAKGKQAKLPAARKGGYKVTAKACPVCGVLNKSRRTGFYCKEHASLRPPKVSPVLEAAVLAGPLA